jgi:FtsH-binding integral membrane protein
VAGGRSDRGVRRRLRRLSHIIYAVAGLGIFGAFTIFDFNRLRRASPDGAVVIAASVFLDIFNVFLLLLELFGGQRD